MKELMAELDRLAALTLAAQEAYASACLAELEAANQKDLLEAKLILEAAGRKELTNGGAREAWVKVEMLDGQGAELTGDWLAAKHEKLRAQVAYDRYRRERADARAKIAALGGGRND